MSIRKLAGLGAIALLVALTPAAEAAGRTATVTIHNKSDWRLDHFYLSPAEETNWGPDQLGNKVIGSGEKFMLTGIPCNTWDVKLVDEEGDECVVEGVDLCKDDAQWTITSKALLACQVE
jgi:hypothetical protein